MSLNKTLILIAACCVTIPGVAQTPPSPPRAPRSVMHRSSERGYLGVGVIDLTDERVKALNLKSDSGVEVKRVERESPASKAGLMENDVIVELNGKTIEDVDQFIRGVSEGSAGSKLNLGVWRAGKKMNLTATLESRTGDIFLFNGAPSAPNAPMPPMPPGFPNDSDFFAGFPSTAPVVGFEGEPLTSQLAAYFGVKDGVLVRFVGPHTPAEKAGLKAGDIVTKVNGTMVTTPREISGLVRAGHSKPISFTVVRDKKEMTLSVQIARLFQHADHDDM